MSAKKNKDKRIALYVPNSLAKRLKKIIDAQHSKMSTYIVGELIEPHVLEVEAKEKEAVS